MNRIRYLMLLVSLLVLALCRMRPAFAEAVSPPPYLKLAPADLAFTTVHMRDHDELAVVNLGHTAAGPFTVTLHTDLGFEQTTIVPGLALGPIYGGSYQTYLVGEYMPLVACTAVRIDAANVVPESNETNNIIKNWTEEPCGYLGW